MKDKELGEGAAPFQAYNNSTTSPLSPRDLGTPLVGWRVRVRG